MVKFKMVDNRTRIAKKLKALEENTEKIQREFLQETAATIVNLSPVDTGTYMDAHNIGKVGSPVSSIGKPTNQPWQPHADRAMERLTEQIGDVPNFSKIFIANSALHAPKVEYDYGYAPYTTARASAKKIFDGIVSRLMKE